jgi:hypothetical protein
MAWLTLTTSSGDAKITVNSDTITRITAATNGTAVLNFLDGESVAVAESPPDIIHRLNAIGEKTT